jgi:RNA polymerase sigma-70 factor (ECF subfamily)
MSTVELERVAALRRQDEAAFAALVEAHHASLVRVAKLYVRDHAVAEEVAQETWLAVMQGIDRFEGRSSLKTWLFRILTNTAKTRAEREGRTVPFSAVAELDEEGAAVEPERFFGSGHRWAGHWAAYPERWETVPDQRLQSDETCACIGEAIAALPPVQRQVITLRDVEGWSAEEVCRLLDLSEGNQRVLLHRARARVRAALERYLADDAAAA